MYKEQQLKYKYACLKSLQKTKKHLFTEYITINKNENNYTKLISIHLYSLITFVVYTVHSA